MIGFFFNIQENAAPYDHIRHVEVHRTFMTDLKYSGRLH